jgi:hypothetical protein
MLSTKRAAEGADCTRHSKDPKKKRMVNMKRKGSLHSVLSKTEILASKGRAIDDRETDAVGRRSFLRKIGIAGASLASVLAVLVTSSAMADGIIVTFKGGIGVMPASTVGSANVVQGVQPPGEPWVIRALSAQVKQDGRIHVEGRGLLLAGGNGIGTNGGQKVFATLICGTALFSTPVANAVPLAADGDFTIDDVLSPVPPLDCANPVLLIRTAAGNDPWFAAGIPVVFQ